MWHGQGEACLGGVIRSSAGGAVDRKPRAAEGEQVEIELTRSPPPTSLAPEGTLQRLQREQEGRGSRRRVGAGRDVERYDRVPEFRLVGDPDRARGIQTRHAAQPDTRQCREGVQRKLLDTLQEYNAVLAK